MTNGTCSIEGCESATHARGWCNTHYSRYHHTGSPDLSPHRVIVNVCSIDGCDGGGKIRRGWCNTHYSRWLVRGDVNWTRPAVEVRFWSYVNKNGPVPEYAPRLGPCWIWTGASSHGGYGSWSYGAQANSVRIGSHRYAYGLLIGPVPEGLELDHLCRVPACCNPDHLEPVTHAENMRRSESGAWQRAKTHCPQGHEYTEANTYVAADGSRTCRKCDNNR